MYQSRLLPICVAVVIAGWNFATADDFVTVDFSMHHNYVLQNHVPGAPTGDVVFGGVPFHIPTEGNNFWDGWYAGGPGTDVRSIDFPVAVGGVREVHTLINTDWGTAGGPFAWLEFFGSDGAYFRKDLYADDDIRDHSPNNGWASQINGVTTVNVWNNGGSGPDYVVLDKQQITLPAEFWSQELASIKFTDAGLGQYHQRAFLAGVTVMVPEPASLSLLALAGLTLVRRR